MSEVVLTDREQEIVEQGEAARFLLDNPLFLQAIETVRAQCAEAILTSPPADREAREDAYQLSRGLSAITAELTAISAAGEQLLATAEAQTDAIDQAQPVYEPGAY